MEAPIALVVLVPIQLSVRLLAVRQATPLAPMDNPEELFADLFLPLRQEPPHLLLLRHAA